MKNYYIFFLLVFSFNIKAQFNYQWVANGGSSGSDIGVSIMTDATGNVYSTGSFTGAANFSTGGSLHSLTSKGGIDVFITKHDANGNIIFANQIGGSDDEQPYDIYVNATSIYVVGKFKGTCDFDPSASTASLTYNGGGTDGDGFVAKYDLNGNYQWAFKLGSTANDRALAITADKNGNLIVSGFFSNTVDFDPGNGTANLTAPINQYNAFFAKYTSAGSYVFAKQLVGDYSEGNDIKTDGNGDIFLFGDWSETVDVDPSGATVNMVTSGQLNFGIFIAKYSSTGNYVWHKTVCGTGLNIARQIAIDANAIYIGGIFSSTNDFDPGLGTATLTSNDSGDILFGKYY